MDVADLESASGSCSEPSTALFQTPSEVLQSKFCLDELFVLIQKLPPLQRLSIQLIKMDGLKVSEAADLLQEDSRAVTLALIRGAKSLRRMIRMRKSSNPYLHERQAGGD
jgi:DNA-directed RNA polymerase specialized sigma24 family protein